MEKWRTHKITWRGSDGRVHKNYLDGPNPGRVRGWFEQNKGVAEVLEVEQVDTMARLLAMQQSQKTTKG